MIIRKRKKEKFKNVKKISPYGGTRLYARPAWTRVSSKAARAM